MQEKNKAASRPRTHGEYGSLQLMPKSRVRLDPSIVPSVACWLIAYAQQWAREVKRTGRGVDDDEKATFESRRRWYKNALSAMNCVLGSLLDTVHVGDIETAKRELAEAFAKLNCPGFDPLTYAQLQTDPQPEE